MSLHCRRCAVWYLQNQFPFSHPSPPFPLGTKQKLRLADIRKRQIKEKKPAQTHLSFVFATPKQSPSFPLSLSHHVLHQISFFSFSFFLLRNLPLNFLFRSFLPLLTPFHPLLSHTLPHIQLKRPKLAPHSTTPRTPPPRPLLRHQHIHTLLTKSTNTLCTRVTFLQP